MLLQAEQTKGWPLMDHITFDGLYVFRYPGHMAKALRLLQDKVKRAHVVIDVRDARVGQITFACRMSLVFHTWFPG